MSRYKLIVVLIQVLFVWSVTGKRLFADDNLLLMWNVPSESPFLGFCGEEETANLSFFLIAPEAPVSLFSKERFEEESGQATRKKDVRNVLRSNCGYDLTYMSPDCTLEREPCRLESLSLLGDVTSGPFSAILGSPFTTDRVLKFEPLKGKAQLRRSSIESRPPIRTYSGRLVTGGMLVLDGIKTQGKQRDCLLSFGAEIDVVIGEDIRQVIPPNDFGQGFTLSTLTNSNPIVRAPVELKLDRIARFDLDGLVFSRLCCHSVKEFNGIKIGWGLLKDMDFELEFRGAEIEMRIYATYSDRGKILRTGELNCEMTDDGLRVLEIADWSVLAKTLQKDDVVTCAGDQNFPGVLKWKAVFYLLSQKYNGGTILLTRKNEKMSIQIQKDQEAFALRDRFLFSSSQP